MTMRPYTQLLSLSLSASADTGRLCAYATRDVHFCVRCGREIWPVRYAADSLGDGFAWMTDLIDTSDHRATIQIPIAMWSTLTTVKHPAVSSLGAYPTPAH